ncbi:transmembrane protein 141 isoform X3 [Phyllopteryx taeniolatus]|uniref:transmembrane protein 141 isoform X3 n=1 Tax=Phyllopteryx taeniolatus TaxID=161469 RepID=UPI002AD32312|nr:transmembrane protein 141 isoform X3 [Phyllopteryx taeniolatus]
MALIATEQGSKMSGTSAIYGCVGPRKDAVHGKTQPKEGDYSTDGLPKAFLHSLRTLFDILDDAGRGYVHISEIESRWQGADTRELPGGVLSCLRRVTPPHGCLTFERFVAGLRYSMLNPENRCQLKAQAAVPPQPPPRSACTRAENKVRPLGPSNVTNIQPHRASSLISRARPEEGGGHPACGPPRYGAGYERSGRSLERIPAAQEAGGSYRVEPGHLSKAPQQQSRVRSIESLALESPQLQGPSVAKSNLPRSQSESATGFTGGSRRHSRSREEPRRHTITSGVDYEMVVARLP